MRRRLLFFLLVCFVSTGALRASIVTRRVALGSALWVPGVAGARNLPSDQGARGNARGDLVTLVPIVRIRETLLEASNQKDPAEIARCLAKSPKSERDFKRLFDEFSDAVSYKQKFLDANAFLVYYTGGFDGPGRPNIEEDFRETRQFGFRNDAWVAVDAARAELDDILNPETNFSSTTDLENFLQDALKALDGYLAIAPKTLVDEAYQQIVVPGEVR